MWQALRGLCTSARSPRCAASPRARWSNPAWFLPPEAVGERVWKVSEAAYFLFSMQGGVHVIGSCADCT